MDSTTNNIAYDWDWVCMAWITMDYMNAISAVVH